MSFILDALKKSETDRQQQGTAEFAGVPRGNGSAGVPRWLWVLGLLLAINLVVLLGLFLRPDATPPNLVSSPNTATREAVANEPSFAKQVADARQNMPARQKFDAAAATSSQPAPSTPPAAASVTAAATRSAILPTIFEVRANGTVELPDLHLDIHVYSDVPEDRFVFINMSKQRENSTLEAGPVVEEITPEGVVLEYRGTSFLLPRD